MDTGSTTTEICGAYERSRRRERSTCPSMTSVNSSSWHRMATAHVHGCAPWPNSDVTWFVRPSTIWFALEERLTETIERSRQVDENRSLEPSTVCPVLEAANERNG